MCENETPFAVVTLDRLRGGVALASLAGATLLALAACSGTPNPPVSTPIPATTAACAKAAQIRAGFPDLVTRGKLHRASLALEEAAALCPESAPAIETERLSVLLALGRFDEARQIADKLAAMPGATSEACALRAMVEERRRVDGPVTPADDPAREAEGALIDSGAEALHAGRAVEASALYREALARRRPNPEALVGLGLALLKTGDPSGAQRSFDRALAEAEAESGASPKVEAFSPKCRVSGRRAGFADYVAFSPTLDHVAYACEGIPEMGKAAIHIMDTRTRRELVRIDLEVERLLGLGFTTGGRSLIVAGLTCPLERRCVEKVKAIADVYSADSGRLMMHLDPPQQPIRYDVLAFAAAGDRVALENDPGVDVLFLDGRPALALRPKPVLTTTKVSPPPKPGELPEEPRRSTALLFSPDENTLFDGGSDGTIAVWDLPSRTLQRTLGKVRPVDIDSLAMMPDGTLVSGQYDDAEPYSRWDPSSGKKLAVPHVPPRDLRGVTEHRRWGRRREGRVDLVDGGFGIARWSTHKPGIEVWDLRGTTPVLRASAGDSFIEGPVSASPNNRSLAAVCSHRRWAYFRGSGAGWGQYSDGSWIGELAICTWDLSTGETRTEYPSGSADIVDFKRSANQSALVATASDATVRVWRLDSGALSTAMGPWPGGRRSDTTVGRYSTPPMPVDVEPSFDGSVIAVILDGETELWRSGVAGEREPLLSTSVSDRLAFSPKDNLLTIADSAKLVVWDVTTTPASTLVNAPATPRSWPEMLVFSPDGHQFARVGERRIETKGVGAWPAYRDVTDIEFWEVRDRVPIRRAVVSAKEGASRSASFSPEGDSFAIELQESAGVADASRSPPTRGRSRIELLATRDGSGVTTLPLQSESESMWFSPDGRLLVMAFGANPTGNAEPYDLRTSARLPLIKISDDPGGLVHAEDLQCRRHRECRLGPQLFATAVGGAIELRSPTPDRIAGVLQAESNSDAGHVRMPDGRFDLVGTKPDDARRGLTCHAGTHWFPIEVCEDRFRVPGILARIASGELVVSKGVQKETSSNSR